MHLSISTGCLYPFPLSLTFRLVAEAGFEGVELVMAPEVWLRGAHRVRRLAEAHGLEVYSVHQTLMRDIPTFGEAARMEDAVNAALELGCPRVVIHGPFTLRWGEKSVQRWLRALERSQKRLCGSGVRLAIENAGVYSPIDVYSVLNPLSLLTDFARRYDLDLTYDTCHAATADIGLIDAYEALRERLTNVHLSDVKDAHPQVRSHLYQTLFAHHQMPGDGYLPLGELISHMSATGYRGPVTLEVSVLALRAWSLRELKRQLARAAAFMHAARQNRA